MPQSPKPKLAWKDRNTPPTYRSRRRRIEAFEQEFGPIGQFDFSILPDNDRAIFLMWLQGQSMRSFEGIDRGAVNRSIRRCFVVLRK